VLVVVKQFHLGPVLFHFIATDGRTAGTEWNGSLVGFGLGDVDAALWPDHSSSSLAVVPTLALIVRLAPLPSSLTSLASARRGTSCYDDRDVTAVLATTVT